MKSHVLSVSCKWCEIFMFFHIIIPSPHFAGACWVNTWYSLNHICSIISVKLLNEPSISLFHSRSLFLAYANQKCIHKFSTHTHTNKNRSNVLMKLYYHQTIYYFIVVIIIITSLVVFQFTLVLVFIIALFLCASQTSALKLKCTPWYSRELKTKAVKISLYLYFWWKWLSCYISVYTFSSIPWNF